MSNYDTYYVVGHDDLTKEEFEANYIPQLNVALDLNSSFILSESTICDKMTQEFLKGKTNKVMLVYAGPYPCYNCGNFPTDSGYEDIEEARKSMSYASSKDIAWERPGHDSDYVSVAIASRASIDGVRKRNLKNKT